jgi:hypothetical protein
MKTATWLRHRARQSGRDIDPRLAEVAIPFALDEARRHD